jgi:hypothetical protein
VTEDEWMACDDREALQNFLQHHPRAPRVRDIERRLRLYTCGCCRLLWDSFPDDACRHAVVIAEAYADGEVDADALAKAHRMVRDLPVPAGVGWEEVENPFGGGRLPTGPTGHFPRSLHTAAPPRRLRRAHAPTEPGGPTTQPGIRTGTNAGGSEGQPASVAGNRFHAWKAGTETPSAAQNAAIVWPASRNRSR